MNIIEVRDGYIQFEADRNISLGSFVQVDGMSKCYIAQIVKVKQTGISAIVYAKLLFIYDGTLLEYDRTLPNKDATVKPFSFNILNNAIDVKTPILVGKTLGENLNIRIDESAFDKKMFINCDDRSSVNIILKNLLKQFNNIQKNVVIVDCSGIIDSDKHIAGSDFKLPLNTEALAFLYNECLTDATPESKATVVDIFKELSEYSKTVPFLPFETLKQIIDDMVDKSHVFRLLVVKNKLARFSKFGYFASGINEVNRLDNILNKHLAVIDVSKLDVLFQNKYIDYIYKKLSKKSNTQVFITLTDSIAKKTLKKIFENKSVKTTFISSYKYKFLRNIKDLFENFIIVPSLFNNDIFPDYSVYLKSMDKNSFLVTGNATKNIPLISKIEEFFETPEYNIYKNHSEIGSYESSLEQQKNDLQNIENAAKEDKDESLTSVAIQEHTDSVINSIEEEVESPVGNMFDAEDSPDENIDEILNDNPDIESEITEDITVKYNETNDNDESVDFNNNNFETIVHEVIDVPENDDTNEDKDLTIQEELQDYEPLDSISQGVEQIQDYDIQNVMTQETKPSDSMPASDNDFIQTEESFSDDVDNIAEEIVETETTDDNASFSDMLEDYNISEGQEESQELQQNGDVKDNDSIMYNEDDFIELNNEDADDGDIIMVDMEEDSIPQEIDEQIVKDVDKVFTTRKDDDLTDSDLDFIDELNNNEDGILGNPDETYTTEELVSTGENEIIEEFPVSDILEEAPMPQNTDAPQEILETKTADTPLVPVYDADIPQEDKVISDPIQQGDSVTNIKYGNGTVEKMIKYGNKTLFSINFENVGRRLVDPTLVEIKKV